MNFDELSIFRLANGAHKTAEAGLCAMETVAWLEGLEHSDHPTCTCPVIATFVRNINDSMPDDQRQRLIAYLPRLVGTVSPEHEQERAEYLAWHAITVITPNVLEQVGLMEHAKALRDLPSHNWDAAADAAADAARAAIRTRTSAAADATSADAASAAAATAAFVAYAAADAADADVWAPALRMLDEVLAIGPQSPGFSAPVESRVAAYRELVRA